jgi:sec-independent protein translocase protein TatA
MVLPHLPLANFGNLFGVDGLVILVIGLLIFGKRLPDVGKNLGKTIVEFKKGLNGTYSGDKDAQQPEEIEEEPAVPPTRRLSSGTASSTRVRTPSRKRLAETEEV